MVEDDIRLGCGKESVWRRDKLCERVGENVCVGVFVREGGGVRERMRGSQSVCEKKGLNKS